MWRLKAALSPSKSFSTFNGNRLYGHTGSVDLRFNNAHPFVLLCIYQSRKVIMGISSLKPLPLLHFERFRRVD